MMETLNIKNQISKIKKRFQCYRNFEFCIFNFKSKKSGFTLLEMLVSVGIFSVVVITAISVLISIRDAQQKAGNIQNIQDNIRFLMEFMTKEMRQGSQYTGTGCVLDECTGFSFLSATGQTVGYCLEASVIRRTVGGIQCSAGSAMTSSNAQITRLVFYLVGETAGPSDGQPRVTIAISGRSSIAKVKTESQFDLQTTITQRIRDL